MEKKKPKKVKEEEKKEEPKALPTPVRRLAGYQVDVCDPGAKVDSDNYVDDATDDDEYDDPD